ncbi:MAG: CoA transferase [Polyangiaceae bacterium]|nr:CoA transferase [Polyangiaceae bacterium]MCW5792659.1 CoA transferase [Polyangiaceae bacterium]
MAALEGVRVLDLTRLLPGPLATVVLADLGATVDKVEDAGAGDYTRLTPPMHGDTGVMFHTLNRGKRAMVLDLKHPEGAQTLKRLVPHYDVVFEQFRPGVLDRLGVSHQALRALNPRLIVCALTGYGQTGPLAKRAGHDLNYLARSGLLGAMGPKEGPPATPSFQLADVSGGLWCVIAILAALRERERMGEGKLIDIGMVESVVPFATPVLSKLLGGEPVARGDEMLTGGLAIYRTYATKDGGAVAFGGLEPKFFQAFFAAVGLPARAEVVLPGPHQAAIQQELTALFASRTRDEWAAFNEEHDVCLEPVLRPDELLADAQLMARRAFIQVETPSGPMTQLGTPVTPPDLQPSPAPSPGQHTSDILREAGFSDAEIEALKSSRAVR